jgi:hypothetical protein
MKLFRIAIAFLLVVPIVCRATAIPDSIAAKGETVVLKVHAAGAQISECKTDETAG